MAGIPESEGAQCARPLLRLDQCEKRLRRCGIVQDDLARHFIVMRHAERLKRLARAARLRGSGGGYATVTRGNLLFHVRFDVLHVAREAHVSAFVCEPARVCFHIRQHRERESVEELRLAVEQRRNDRANLLHSVDCDVCIAVAVRDADAIRETRDVDTVVGGTLGEIRAEQFDFGREVFRHVASGGCVTTRGKRGNHGSVKRGHIDGRSNSGGGFLRLGHFVTFR